jgi:hypothetical protein
MRSGNEEVIDSIDHLIERAHEATDQLAFVGRTEGRQGRTALWFAEDFRYELDERLVPRLERLKRALRNKDAPAAQEVVA